MALDGPLDADARENLSRSHAASKSLLFTINDLLDLTRLESGRETSFNEPFDLHETIEKATLLYRREAERRNLQFHLELEDTPIVLGDATKIQTLVQNLTANALKYTTKGIITVSCTIFHEPEGTHTGDQMVVDITVADTGSGMSTEKLENIFRDLEQVGTLEPTVQNGGLGASMFSPRLFLSIQSPLGLGLAVVARIVEQLGGQLRVNSKVDEGSQFSFLIPLVLECSHPVSPSLSRASVLSGDSQAKFPNPRRRSSSTSDLESFIESMVGSSSGGSAPRFPRKGIEPAGTSTPPIRAVKVDTFASEVMTMMTRRSQIHLPLVTSPPPEISTDEHPYLRILIVEDNDINRLILAKRLVLDRHTVATTTNGQEGFDKVFTDRGFDVVLMDLQMPILNGFEATQKIRELERTSPAPLTRLSHRLNGRIPIFAVSASLAEKQHDELLRVGMDGWILKPIDFQRLGVIMKGVTDANQKALDVYRVGCSWEKGGWLRK
ncbi:hypothetical protein C0991_001939 [Blastosporella zonata]|nr:hypothetical protein C0991_001939 [Blastosporella zonata]